jgi:hypothetical protein
VAAPAGARVAIIGDDVEADLGAGACELGLWRILGAFSPSFPEPFYFFVFKNFHN